MHPQRRFSVYNSKHKDEHNHTYMGAGNGGTMIWLEEEGGNLYKTRYLHTCMWLHNLRPIWNVKAIHLNTEWYINVRKPFKKNSISLYLELSYENNIFTKIYNKM